MIRLTRIGHVALRVADVERSRKFYSTLLGFEVVEEDPEHGGVFMALEGLSHTIDLFPIPDGQPHRLPPRPRWPAPPRAGARGGGPPPRRLPRGQRAGAQGCVSHASSERRGD